jgi:Phage integrase family
VSDPEAPLWETVRCGSTAESWGWRTAWRKLTKEAGLEGLRPHDLRHHAITKLAESPEASEQTIMAIAGHVSREMLEHYSHVRQEAKRKAVESLDNVTITSQLAKWEAEATNAYMRTKPSNNETRMVGTGRFELPTPRTPSECSTRLSHVPTKRSSPSNSTTNRVNTRILHYSSLFETTPVPEDRERLPRPI